MFNKNYMRESEKDMKIVIKLGGSVVTYKDVNYFPLEIEEIKEQADKYIRYDVIRKIGREIKEAVGESGLRFILVNGAGPFGHYLVDLKRPDEDIRKSVRYLNEKIVSEFRKMGFDVVSVPPSESCEFVNGQFEISKMWELTEKLIENDKILSTYGDVLKDGKIISGDDLIVSLAKLWNADKIVAVTDVKGVYTVDPKTSPSAIFVERIYSGKKTGKVKIQYSTNVADVTGGMESKIEKLVEGARHGIKGQVVSGLKEGSLKAALLGDETIGTLILP